jgi:hypothetical protein
MKTAAGLCSAALVLLAVAGRPGAAARAPGLPHWPAARHGPTVRRMRIDVDSRVEDDTRAARYGSWTLFTGSDLRHHDVGIEPCSISTRHR